MQAMGHGGMGAAPYGIVPGAGAYMPMRAPYSQPMGYGPPMGAPYGQPMPMGAPYHPMPYGHPMPMGGPYMGGGMMPPHGAVPYGAMPMAGHAHSAPYPMQHGHLQPVVKPFFPGELPILR